MSEDLRLSIASGDRRRTKGAWLPRHGRKLDEEPHPGVLEIGVSAVLAKLRKILPHPIYGILAAALIAFAGRGELQLRSYGLLLIAIWLVADLWEWLLGKNTRWRAAIGAAITSFILIAVMGSMQWLLGNQLEEQRQDVFDHLVGAIYASPSGDAVDSVFSIRNGGRTGFSDHRLTCLINFLSFNNNEVIFDKATMWFVSPPGLPLAPGGDGQSESCLSKFVNARNLTCADVTYRYDYALATQPNDWQSKSFRFVTKRSGDKLGWYVQPLAMRHSECETPETAPPDTSGYRRVTVCSSGCDYDDLQQAANKIPCATVVYFQQTSPIKDFTFPPTKGCDAQHWIIIKRSNNPKADALHIEEQ